jgi:hypothetical protein
MTGDFGVGAYRSQSASQNQSPTTDRWAAWPVFATLTITLIVATLCGFPGIVSFLLIPLAVLGAPLVGAGLLVMALVVSRRRPHMAVSILIAVLAPVLLWKPIAWAADTVHLALAVWAGAVQPDGPFVGYDWSVGLAGGPATFLIYDVTDEIALPPELHKQPIAFEQGFGEICAGKVTHLLGHYYVCEFDNIPSNPTKSGKSPDRQPDRTL